MMFKHGSRLIPVNQSCQDRELIPMLCGKVLQKITSSKRLSVRTPSSRRTRHFYCDRLTLRREYLENCKIKLFEKAVIGSLLFLISTAISSSRYAVGLKKSPVL